MFRIKLFTTTFILTILTVLFWAGYFGPLKASHSCGQSCDQFTAEGNCTHGCGVTGADPNPDYRVTQDSSGNTIPDPSYNNQPPINLTQDIGSFYSGAPISISPINYNIDGGNLNQVQQLQQQILVNQLTQQTGLQIYTSGQGTGGANGAGTPNQCIWCGGAGQGACDSSCQSSLGSGLQCDSGYTFNSGKGQCEYTGSTTGATSANDFGGNAGVYASLGPACDNFTTPGPGTTGLKCHGEVKINICPNGPNQSSPVCIVPSPTVITGDVDCVSIANQNCAFVQLDVAGGRGSMTCYPTSYSSCGGGTTAQALMGGTTATTTTTTTTTTNGGGGPTPTPPLPPPSCNDTCTTNAGCPSNLTCSGGFCRNSQCTTETNCICPGSSFLCQQLKTFRGGVEITAAQIQKGDTIVFRGFASTINTTISKLRFTLTKASVAQTPVDVTAILTSGQYQADYQVVIDQAVSYSVTVVPISP